MNELRERVIVLRTVKYSEADLIVTALNASGARVSAMARAALKSKKRFGGGVLEPTHHIEWVIRQGRDKETMPTLQEARLLNGFEGLRVDYETLEKALSIVEIITKIAQPEDIHSQHLYDLLGHSLKALAAQEAPKIGVIERFSLKVLYHQGVLEVEDWMHPYLRAPIHHSEPLLALDIIKSRWVWNQLNEYAARAERT